MEYKQPLFAIFAILGLLFWSFDFFKLFKKPEIHLPKKEVLSALLKTVRAIAYIVGVVAWLLIGYALTGPRIPKKFTESNIEVNDIFFVVDVSRSMLAIDFKPNRLEAAKEKIQEFANLMPTDRLGIVVFSERVFTLLPLTTDLELVKKIVGEISVGPLGSGTNIGDAIGLAVGRASSSEAKNKVIILLTDGVSNVGSMTPLQAAEQAKKQGLKVYTIAIGGDENAKIPLGNTIFGQRYQSIPGGSTDEDTLKQVAKITGGKFFTAKNKSALENVLSEISNLEKTKVKVMGKVVYEELFFQYLFWGILLFMMVEVFRKAIVREVL